MRERFLEEAFLLQYHLKMSYSDIRSLPLPYRRWFIERITEEFKKQADARKKASDESRGMVDIPMGEMFSQNSSTQNQPRQDTQVVPRRGKTLKF